jgi:hypothetical protein
MAKEAEIKFLSSTNTGMTALRMGCFFFGDIPDSVHADLKTFKF